MKIPYKLSILFITLSSLVYGQHATIEDARLVCDSEKSLFIPSFNGEGRISTNSKIILPKDFQESNSFWLTFTPAESNDLSFLIEPFDKKSDIDFVLFDVNLTPIRSIFSGSEKGNSLDGSCLGNVGLVSSDSDYLENKGCKNSNGFANAIRLEKNKQYYIWIHNYSNNKGFILNFLSNIKLNPVINQDKNIVIYDSLISINNSIALISDIKDVEWNTKDISTKKCDMNSFLGRINSSKGELTQQISYNLNTCKLQNTYEIELIEKMVKHQNYLINSISIYPNPAKDLVELEYNLDLNDNHKIRIFSSSGVLVFEEEQKLNTSNEYKRVFDLTNYIPGVLSANYWTILKTDYISFLATKMTAEKSVIN